MPDVLSVSRQDGVAIIRIDNPPVNALSHAVRAALIDALTAIESDAEVVAAVLTCVGRTFVAGADITEFGKPRQPPLLSDVIDRLDAMTKPVVAAIFGTTLGGGLELALGCHARVAAPKTMLGFPEVKLGLIPGAGGTQRLPRAVGPVMALKMIVSGAPIFADEAREHGLIDELADGDLEEASLAQARRLAGQGAVRRLRDETAKLAADIADRKAFDAAAAELTRRARGLKAPHACVDAVRGALDLPFDEGLQNERAIFRGLVEGDQSKAQRYAFFAERAAAKVPGLAKDVKPRTIKRVAVIGAGTMGRGIAVSFADAGVAVTLIETDGEAMERGLKAVETIYDGAARRGRIRPDEAARRFGRIRGAVGLSEAADADLVVEAVFEDFDLKCRILAELATITGEDTVLATNTSYLDVNAIAAATARPASVLGMHFFSPANVMRLVEVVRGAATAPEALATVIAAARRLGKVPVVVGVCHGFVGNRMLRRRSAAAEQALLAGALPHEVDAALVEFGFPMGPFAVADLAGLDIGWRMRKAQGLTADIADALCERGRFGQKSGKGYFRYEAGSRTPHPDPEVEAIIVDASRRLGVARRTLKSGEIIERLLLPLINEGAHILEEGIAARPGDIDVIWVNGYGWPVWRGGPMYYADTLGLVSVRDRLAAMAAASGDETLEPAPLIERLAEAGEGFGSIS